MISPTKNKDDDDNLSHLQPGSMCTFFNNNQRQTTWRVDYKKGFIESDKSGHILDLSVQLKVYQ